MSIYTLLSIPKVNVSRLPLQLTPPTIYNSGGYTQPVLVNGILDQEYAYSDIDILVAGLECIRRDILWAEGLSLFFDRFREDIVAYNWVTCNFAVKYGERIAPVTLSIAECRLIGLEDTALDCVMRRNAPLSFKWRN